MSRRTAAEHVGDIHIAQAASAGKPPVVISSFGNDDSVLRLAKRPTRTEEQKARSDEQDAIDARKASRRVAKFTMLLTHGCRGKSCRSKRHEGDRDRYGGREDGGEGMHALLSMLGLREEAPRAKSATRRFEQ
jgi:hypothetical protein